MKKFSAFAGIFLGLILIVYLMGPKPSAPNFDTSVPEIPGNLNTLETWINSSEKHVEFLKPDNQARIVWADTNNKTQTEWAIVYLHGYSATWAEGEPVHKNLAKYIHANLFLSRLVGHGIENGENMLEITAENLYQSAKEALFIGEKLGKKVIVVGTSTGGTLALKLAADFPGKIAGLILYSPNIEIHDKSAYLLNKPWGLKIAETVFGGNKRGYEADSLTQNYWTTKNQRLESLVQLQEFLEATMTNETFEKINIPVFVGYYYRNENECDQVVSVPAMHKMFGQLASLEKIKLNFPETQNHVLGSYIKSKNYQKLELCSKWFLREKVLN